jgi:hypothetical protein
VDPRRGGKRWVVVIEVDTAYDGGSIELWRLTRLLQRMQELEPVGLHSADRVALQVRIDADGEGAALRSALTNLHSALPKVGLPKLRFVRAEVVTEEQFAQDCALAYDGATDGSPHLRAVAGGGAAQPKTFTNP